MQSSMTFEMIRNVKLRLLYSQLKHVPRTIQTVIVQDITTLMDMISVYKLHTLKIDTHRSYSNKPEIVRQSELVQALNSLHSLKELKISFIDEILTNNFQKVNINLEKLSTLSSVIHIFDFKSLKFLDLSWNLDMKSCKASALKSESTK
ncbi:hypothetical protein ACKWTF_011441 [Chironomus riparius]